MSTERFDIVIRFLTGPLALQDQQIYRGPVVRLGSNPGAGGCEIAGVRGVDARHAVISAYDDETVQISPVGTAQVRVSPHHNVNWDDVDPIRNAVFLADGSAVHLGPPGRGISFQFLEARGLGVWQQQRILSDASQAAPEVEETAVEELDTEGGVPAWFKGGVLLIGSLTTALVLLFATGFMRPEIKELGPQIAGQEIFDVVDESEPILADLADPLQQGFAEFVMIPNAQASGQKSLAQNADLWDQRLLDMTARSLQQHSKSWRFWKRLDSVAEHYALVTNIMRENKLPDVFAAIPYTETGYLQTKSHNYVCARGWWQFMPEVGKRYDLEIDQCVLKTSDGREPYKITGKAPVRRVCPRADYVDSVPKTESRTGCKCILQCGVDERIELEPATRAAAEYFKDPWEDPLFRESGALVQMTISTFNAGWDDAVFTGKRRKPNNIKPAYEAYLKKKRLEVGPHFIGDQITCGREQFGLNTTCGGFLIDQSQHYAYSTIARHLLAACYYGKNYATEYPQAFGPWKKYTRGRGYCKPLAIPDSDEVKRH
jgi:hypothetical protein